MFKPIDDDAPIIVPKFPDCETCVNLGVRRICRECDSGEFYEEVEADGLDTIFRNDA